MVKLKGLRLEQEGCTVVYSLGCLEGEFSETELPVTGILGNWASGSSTSWNIAASAAIAPSQGFAHPLGPTSKIAYNNKALLTVRRCALASTLMGIYPMRKAPPGAREKSALTEEHTEQEELSCPNCAEELPDEAANFCPKCGTELPDETAKFCSNCGEELPDEAANFCPKCGAEQQGQQAETNEEPTQPSSDEDPDEEPPRRGGPEGPSRGPSGPSGKISGPSRKPSGPSGKISGPSRRPSGPSGERRGRRAREGVDRAKAGAEAAKERAQER